jgi:3-deoxy-7-phosphoheptulonate synthase
VPVYRGDGVNGFPSGDREPDPNRLLEAYRASAITLNFMRSVIAGGFADLHHPYSWNLHHIEQTPRWPEYRDILDRILDSVHFMESVGGINPRQVGEISLFTSHEGLVLPYEESLVRQDPASGRSYLLSAHMPWIGDRTRELDDAHVEFFRGIANPIGIKLGPGTRVDDLPPLLERLNPEREAGRVTLITRFGAERNRDLLPGCIRRVASTGHEVAWSCDPMHGNTHVVGRNQIKTRRFDEIINELESTMQIHRSEGTVLAGLHFEMTGEDVTECIGGPQELTEQDLSRKYESYCDPRLNYAQSMEVAFLVANRLKERGPGLGFSAGPADQPNG